MYRGYTTQFLWSYLAHVYKSFHPSHPVAALITLVSLNISLHAYGYIVVFRLKRSGKFSQLINGIRLQQISIVKMIEQNLEAPLGILDLGGEVCRGLR